MNKAKLLDKIISEIKDRNISENYAKALMNAPEELRTVVEYWVDGEEMDFSFQNISLQMIRDKENCSYLKAILKMNLLLSNPVLAAGYMKWTPVNKDWRR